MFAMLSDPVMWLVLCSLNMIPYFIRDNLSTAFNINPHVKAVVFFTDCFYLVGWVLSCSVDCGEKTHSAGNSSENRDV